MFRRKHLSAAFTLIEVLISMVILGCGLVVILQSYLAAMNVALSSENYLSGARFAQQKAAELEILARERGGLLPGTSAGNFTLDGRVFRWTAVVAQIEEPAYLSNNTVSSVIRLEWEERGRMKETAVAGYLPKGKANNE